METSHREGFGSTKLNKALWFAEARTFEAFGKPITGETFVRDKYGPRSQHLTAVCDELERNAIIEKFVERIYDFEAIRYRAFEPPSTVDFSDEEFGFADWWISFIDKHTATSISDLSHDYGWEIAGMGEVLPLYAFLAQKSASRARSAKLTGLERKRDASGSSKCEQSGKTFPLMTTLKMPAYDGPEHKMLGT